jgi:acetyl-CoA carboxylase carboxyl transferase subunit beta
MTLEEFQAQIAKYGRRILPEQFVTCKKCKRRAVKPRWQENLWVCPFCGKYKPMPSNERLAAILDEGSMQELDKGMRVADPLQFDGYEQKAKKTEHDTGLSESAVTAVGTIMKMPVTVVILDSRFFMGSMSCAVGERVTRAIEYATAHRTPLIIFSASGGARMQEGIYSLMQMAKTSAAIQEFQDAGGLYISYLTHPTTGGVTASFASLGDITLAEPGALIGFAGPRVIEQTIGEKLPKGFQRSEYLEQHGFVDRIVERKEMKKVLCDILRLHMDAGIRAVS